MIRILFFGRKKIGLSCLRWLVRTKDVEVVALISDHGRDTIMVNAFADQVGIPVFTLQEYSSWCRALDHKPDIGVSVLFSQRIDTGTIESCTRGIINFHPAPLPDFKGVAGYNVAILERLRSWAVSAHYVTEFIDEGAIIEVLNFPIECETQTAFSLEQTTMEYLEVFIKNIITRAINCNERLSTQPNIGGRYISRSEMEEMKRISDGDDIGLKIRAFWFPPYDGAFIERNGERYTLVDSDILQSISDGKFCRH